MSDQKEIQKSADAKLYEVFDRNGKAYSVWKDGRTEGFKEFAPLMKAIALNARTYFEPEVDA